MMTDAGATAAALGGGGGCGDYGGSKTSPSFAVNRRLSVAEL